MSKRVSHSLLDPLFFPFVKPLYRILPIPRRFPPEGIIAIGHLIAAAGAVGFAYSATEWWGGYLAAAGVAGNHLADMVDGTHARQSGQCRNGGELLDHFTDPLSFSYWMIGIGVCAGLLPLAIVSILWIYATAVLTNIKAKMVGEFTLARIGPTEFKATLVLFGLFMAIQNAVPNLAFDPVNIPAVYFAWFLAIGGVCKLTIWLIKAVREVNQKGSKPDTSEWQLGSKD